MRCRALGETAPDSRHHRRTAVPDTRRTSARIRTRQQELRTTEADRPAWPTSVPAETKARVTPLRQCQRESCDLRTRIKQARLETVRDSTGRYCWSSVRRL